MTVGRKPQGPVLPPVEPTSKELDTTIDDLSNLDSESLAEYFMTCPLDEGPNSKEFQALGVSRETFVKWLHTQEAQHALSKLRSRLDQYLDTALTKIIGESVGQLSSRMNEETPVYSAKGDHLYDKKVDLHTITRIFATTFDKRQLVRRNPTVITDRDQSLQDLAETLRGLGKPEPKSLDAAELGLGKPSDLGINAEVPRITEDITSRTSTEETEK